MLKINITELERNTMYKNAGFYLKDKQSLNKNHNNDSIIEACYDGWAICKKVSQLNGKIEYKDFNVIKLKDFLPIFISEPTLKREIVKNKNIPTLPVTKPNKVLGFIFTYQIEISYIFIGVLLGLFIASIFL
jgi:hypothetical protein